MEQVNLEWRFMLAYLRKGRGELVLFFLFFRLLVQNSRQLLLRVLVHALRKLDVESHVEVTLAICSFELAQRVLFANWHALALDHLYALRRDHLGESKRKVAAVKSSELERRREQRINKRNLLFEVEIVSLALERGVWQFLYRDHEIALLLAECLVALAVEAQAGFLAESWAHFDFFLVTHNSGSLLILVELVPFKRYLFHAPVVKLAQRARQYYFDISRSLHWLAPNPAKSVTEERTLHIKPLLVIDFTKRVWRTEKALEYLCCVSSELVSTLKVALTVWEAFLQDVFAVLVENALRCGVREDLERLANLREAVRVGCHVSRASHGMVLESETAECLGDFLLVSVARQFE